MHQLGRPLDRLAAAIVDVFVLLAPLYMLVSAPLKAGLTTSFILDTEPEFSAGIVLMVLVAFVLVVVYQTLCHYFFGATIGKRLFDLKVVPLLEGEQLDFWNLLFRSCVWLFEALCLGLPWLSLFSNPKRRPLHDRVCDTVVVTRGQDGVKPPAAWERALVRSVFSIMIAVFVAAGYSQVRLVLEKLKHDETVATLLVRDSGQCEIVSRSQDAFSGELPASASDDEHARLNLAMALYAAGLADRACLESEVEHEMTRQIPVAPVTYLAQAFVYADDVEVSNAYLDEVCVAGPDGVECAMSRLVSAWSEDNWADVEDALTSAPVGSGYLEVWGVRHYMKQAHYQKALAMLDALITRHDLAEFTMVQRVKALFNMYREGEATAALAQAVVSMPSEQTLDLTAWMCAQQLQASCSAMSGLACAQALPKADGDVDFTQDARALAGVLARECRSGEKIDYLDLSESASDPAWTDFLHAIHKRQREDRSTAATLLAKIINNEDAHDLLRVEAFRRLSKFADRRQMEQLVKSWGRLDSREVWVKGGNFLLTRLAEQRNSELALNVARALMGQESLSPSAAGMLAALTSEASAQERQPASTGKRKDNIKSILQKLGEDE